MWKNFVSIQSGLLPHGLSVPENLLKQEFYVIGLNQKEVPLCRVATQVAALSGSTLNGLRRLTARPGLAPDNTACPVARILIPIPPPLVEVPNSPEQFENQRLRLGPCPHYVWPRHDPSPLGAYWSIGKNVYRMKLKR